MGWEDIRSEIEGRLADAKTAGDIPTDTRIKYPAKSFERTIGAAPTRWLELKILTVPSRHAGMGTAGNQLKRRKGIISIIINEPEHAGLKGVSDLADKLTTVFEFKTFAGVVCREATFYPEVGTEDGYTQHAFSVPFHYDDM